MKRGAKACNFRVGKPQKNTTEKDKVINRNKDNRQEKTMEEPYKNNKKEEKEKKPKEKKYASTKVASKGISEELIKRINPSAPPVGDVVEAATIQQNPILKLPKTEIVLRCP
jgi:hypothetical protein